MLYEIIRIDPVKINKKGYEYRRIVFKPQNYDFNEHPVLFCDVVKGFRNTENWFGVFMSYDRNGAGFLVSGIKIRDRHHVDADSFPKIVRRDDKIKIIVR